MEKFGVLDFETYEWVNPLCIGFVWDDGTGLDEEYIVNRDNPNAVVDGALTLIHSLANHGVRKWWAHNGGKFDYLFILSRALDRGWHANANVAAGRIVRLELYPPDASKTRIICQDSFAVIPSALGDKKDTVTGKLKEGALTSFGIHLKKEFQESDYKEDMRSLSPEKLKSGCMADCHATYQLIAKVSTMFEEWGGKLKSTFSASAMSVLKAHLAEEIPSHEGLENVQQLARESYFGGRVEIFSHMPKDILAEYDINSSYPAAMLRAFPWQFIGKFDDAKAKEAFESETTEGIFYADVECPASQLIPLLPYRNDGMFFPVGSWQGWFAKPELALARKLGYSVNIVTALVYTRQFPFAAFIEKLYDARLKSVGAAKNFLKLVMNGCYGKFAQKPEKKRLVLFSKEEEGIAYSQTHPVELINGDWRFLVEDAFAWAPHTHYAIASYVTAYARCRLWQFLNEGRKGLAYCDTDSIHTPACLGLNKECSNSLGGLKLEHSAFKGKYFAPKLYVQEMPEGKAEYASKGFTVDKETFEEVVAGVQVKTKAQLALLKTQLRNDNDVTLKSTLKRWSGRSMKRKVLRDGSTKPWSVIEIERGDHLKQLSPLYDGQNERKE